MMKLKRHLKLFLKKDDERARIITTFVLSLKIFIIMKLKQVQIKKLQQKLQIGKCPHCGFTEEKLVSPNVYQLMSYNVENGTLKLDGDLNYQPLLAVRCPKCAYTMMFNLIDLGVF